MPFFYLHLICTFYQLQEPKDFVGYYNLQTLYAHL